MSHSAITRATCVLLAAAPERLNVVALPASSDRARAALAHEVAAACAGVFPAGTLWLDLDHATSPLSLVRLAESQLGIPRSGDYDLGRRCKSLQRELGVRGRALLILAEPADASLATWAASNLVPRDGCRASAHRRRTARRTAFGR